MGRIANPDINRMPGTTARVRCNGEIHALAARFSDNNAVALCPWVLGEQLATGVKPLNERLRPSTMPIAPRRVYLIGAPYEMIF